MPPVCQRMAPRRRYAHQVVSTGRAPSPNRRPGRGPGWRTWVLSLAVTAAIVVAVIVFVTDEDKTANQPAAVTSKAAIVEQNREARIIVDREQAPHEVALRAHATPRAAIRAAVVRYMNGQIATHTIDGPVTGSRCASTKTSPRARLAFRCDVVAASVNYPFFGVVDTTARRVTYCKYDPPPVPSMKIPVSRRCT